MEAGMGTAIFQRLPAACSYVCPALLGDAASTLTLNHALLSAHFQEQRELRFYADTLCISVHYLCEAVYAAGGHYPKHYIHQSLISEAKYLLAYTPRSAAAISEELGLPNPAWFSRLFKRETGLTPGEFRKQFRR